MRQGRTFSRAWRVGGIYGNTSGAKKKNQLALISGRAFSNLITCSNKAFPDARFTPLNLFLDLMIFRITHSFCHICSFYQCAFTIPDIRPPFKLDCDCIQNNNCNFSTFVCVIRNNCHASYASARAEMRKDRNNVTTARHETPILHRCIRPHVNSSPHIHNEWVWVGEEIIGTVLHMLTERNDTCSGSAVIHCKYVPYEMAGRGLGSFRGIGGNHGKWTEHSSHMLLTILSIEVSLPCSSLRPVICTAMHI